MTAILALMPPDDHFVVPIGLELLATFVMAAIGATAATRRGYDYIGVLMTGIVSAIGGSLLRDGIFLQRTPVAVSDVRILVAILIGCAAGTAMSRMRRGIARLLLMIDAVGLGAYAVVGTQASLDAQLPAMAAALVGLLNAVGGGVLRDIAIREEPLVFKPGEHYAGAALAGTCVFLGLNALHVHRWPTGIAAIAVVFGVRMASAWLGLKTRPLASMGWMERS